MTSFERDQNPDTEGLGSNPIELFLSSDRETRLNILTSHPQVIGFVYLYEGSITKAFLPKQVIDWTTNDKTVVAVSGTPEDYVPFSVPEKVLTGNNLFICESVDFFEDVQTVSASKYFKDNRKKLESIPECASTDEKTKNLIAVAFPTVLPLVKGLSFQEGLLQDEFVRNEFNKVHSLYEDFLHLKTEAETLDSSFFNNDKPCPKPDSKDIVFVYKLPVKMLICNSNKANINALTTIKAEIARFKGAQVSNTPRTGPVTVPKEVVTGNDHNTVITNTSTTQDASLIEKNDRLISLLSIYFAKPVYNRNGGISLLIPGELTDEALELLSSTSATSDQASILADGLKALVAQVSQERYYLSRQAKLPFFSQTALLYMLKTNWYNGPIDQNHEDIKKSFNLLALLPPPIKKNEDYEKYINSSRNCEIEDTLNQPSDKRSAVKKDIFLKGKQETLKDVVQLISNVVVFARYWVKMNEEWSSQPLIIQFIVEIADYISTSDYEYFHKMHISSKKYMPHALIAYIFNINAVFVKMAKNPSVIRKFKIDNTIDPREVRIATMMTKKLLDQLHLCVATGTPQLIFAQQPSSFSTFCPHLIKSEFDYPKKKRSFQDTDAKEGSNKKPLASKGSIINTTGKKIHFPRGLKHKYCAEFLDTGSSCHHGDNCNFIHAVWPNGFPEEDKKLMEEHVTNTQGYSFVNKGDKKVS